MKEFWLLIHLFSLVVGVGGGFSLFVLMKKSASLDPQKRAEFMQTAAFLGKISPFGLLGLIVSGIAMTVPHWETLAPNHLFHIKLLLVIVLSGIIGFIQVLQKKARTQGPASVAATMNLVAPLPVILNTCIIILAVLIFK